MEEQEKKKHKKLRLEPKVRDFAEKLNDNFKKMQILYDPSFKVPGDNGMLVAALYATMKELE